MNLSAMGIEFASRASKASADAYANSQLQGVTEAFKIVCQDNHRSWFQVRASYLDIKEAMVADPWPHSNGDKEVVAVRPINMEKI